MDRSIPVVIIILGATESEQSYYLISNTSAAIKLNFMD